MQLNENSVQYSRASGIDPSLIRLTCFSMNFFHKQKTICQGKQTLSMWVGSPQEDCSCGQAKRL